MLSIEGKINETCSIGSFNEWKDIDLIKVMIKTIEKTVSKRPKMTYCKNQ